MAKTLKVRDAADVLGVTPARVRELIATGRIKAEHHPTAYHWMIEAAELKRYIAKGRTGHGRPRAVDITKSETKR
jgi:hypothetical protein